MIIFHLKKVWFEKIKAGEKKHEYREFKPYWVKRIKKYFNFLDEEIEDMRSGDIFLDRYEPIIFRCGYNGECITAKAVSIRIIDGQESDLKINKDVFDIEFELIKEV